MILSEDLGDPFKERRSDHRAGPSEGVWPSSGSQRLCRHLLEFFGAERGASGLPAFYRCQADDLF